MELIKTFRGFHWITKAVIGLTLLLLGLILAAAIMQLYWMANQSDQNAFNAGQGLGFMAISLASVLWQAFFLLLIVIAIYMALTRIRTWIEKYLDAVLGKLDSLAEQKRERDAAGTTLAAMNEKVSRMEKKLDHIESILSKVSE